MADKKSVPLGEPLPLTERQLDMAAVITGEDIKEAKELWRESAPEKFWNLLDAEFVEDSNA